MKRRRRQAFLVLHRTSQRAELAWLRRRAEILSAVNTCLEDEVRALGVKLGQEAAGKALAAAAEQRRFTEATYDRDVKAREDRARLRRRTPKRRRP